MTVDEVYEFFGSAVKATAAIGLKRANFSLWVKNRRIPLKSQKKFEKVTQGKLIANEELEKKQSERKKFDFILDEEKPVLLPFFRYYDKKYGMLVVDSIHFKKGRNPRITYAPFQRKNEKFSVLNTENLMQATSLIDCEGKTLYEGDILLLKNGKKVTFESIEMTETIKKLGKFKIIGNIFE